MMLSCKGKIIIAQGNAGFCDQPWARKAEAWKLRIFADDVAAENKISVP